MGFYCMEPYRFGRLSVGRGCISVRAFGYWWGVDVECRFVYRVKVQK